MSSAAAANSESDLRDRGQQPILASQRSRDQVETPAQVDGAKTPKQADGAQRFTQYFPLGYREAFSQWVMSYRILYLSAILTSM